jgi:hypothetical protein
MFDAKIRKSWELATACDEVFSSFNKNLYEKENN